MGQNAEPRARVSAGVPTGGQFAAQQRAEADVDLMAGLDKRADAYYGRPYDRLQWWERDEVDLDLRDARWDLDHAEGRLIGLDGTIRLERRWWRVRRNRRLARLRVEAVEGVAAALERYNEMRTQRGMKPLPSTSR